MIWIVGHKGMLGSELSTMLQAAHIPFIGTDTDVDITNLESLSKFISNKPVTWIVNCSGYTAVDKAEEEKIQAFRLNEDGVKNLVEIANSKNATLIHISTEFVFDGEKLTEYVETDIPKPKTIYGYSKYQGECAILEKCSKYFILRTSWLYGRFKQNFVYMMLNLFYRKSTIEIVDDQTGSPTNCTDVCLAIIKLITSNAIQYGLYHFSNTGKTDWYEYTCKIFELAMQYKTLPRDLQLTVRILPITTSEYKTNASRPVNSYLDSSKFSNMFHVKIRTWQEALEDFVKGLKPVIGGYNARPHS